MQILTTDHIHVDQRLDAAQGAVGGPALHQVAAAVETVGCRPFAESFFAIEPDQVYVIVVRHTLQRGGHLQQECCGRATVVRAHETYAGHLLRVVVPGKSHDAAGLTGKARNEIDHRHGTAGSAADE